MHVSFMPEADEAQQAVPPVPPPAPPIATPAEVSQGEPADKHGDLSKKVENIENSINLVFVVLGVGFLAIAITIILFAISAYNERTASYDQLLGEVNTLKVEMHVVSKGQF
jgi:hypothetical protein